MHETPKNTFFEFQKLLLFFFGSASKTSFCDKENNDLDEDDFMEEANDFDEGVSLSLKF